MTDHKSLTAALVAFQAELPDVSKGGTNPAFKSKYATLPDVTKAVFPVLAKHGLAWVCLPDVTDDGPILRWELRHLSGESLTGVWPLPDGAKAQDLGSWHTYGRRYCLSAVTGITPDEDDDGNAASKGPGAAPRQARTTRAADSQDKIAAAIQATTAATTAERLDEIEAKAKAFGIDGIDRVRAALDAKRVELGPSATDHWATTGIPEES
jgi:hypothetical protein